MLRNNMNNQIKYSVILVGAMLSLSSFGDDSEILNVSKKSPIISPLTTIRQMAAIMKRCSLVVANDAGPLHLAVSQKVKTVSIFGPSDERVYGPYPPGAKNIVVAKDLGCRPCYLRFKIPDCKTRRCLEDITSEEVLGAIKKLSR